MAAKQRISDRLLMRVQAGSGLVFSAFLVVHLLAVMVSPFGASNYDRIQDATRPVYQAPAYELLLLFLPLGVHIAAGILRMRRRPRTFATRELPWRTRLHRYGAWFLLFFIVGHAAATRVPSLVADATPGFAGVSYATSLLPAYFYPYYTLLGIAGLVHGGYGAYLSLRVLGMPRFDPRRVAWVMRGALVAGSLLVFLGVLSFGGAFYAIPDPSDHPYARFLREFYP